jgi:DNA-directed RNA polymerase subunit RPC12/RpoP
MSARRNLHPIMSVPMWKCNICSHVAVYKSSIAHHMREHVKKKSLESEHCDKEDAANFVLNNREYKCSHCTATCPDKEDMKRHIQSHQRKCSHCNFVAFRKRHGVEAKFESKANCSK